MDNGLCAVESRGRLGDDVYEELGKNCKDFEDYQADQAGKNCEALQGSQARPGQEREPEAAPDREAEERGRTKGRNENTKRIAGITCQEIPIIQQKEKGEAQERDENRGSKRRVENFEVFV